MKITLKFILLKSVTMIKVRLRSNSVSTSGNNSSKKSSKDSRDSHNSHNSKESKESQLLPFRLLYMNMLLTYKKEIYDQTNCYISNKHLKYNEHLTNVQYWILYDILSRKYISLNEYLHRLHDILKKNCGIIYTDDLQIANNYDNILRELSITPLYTKHKEYIPYLCEYILLIDHKNEELFDYYTQENEEIHPKYTYIGILINDIICPLIIEQNRILGISIKESNIFMKKEEIYSLFLYGKYKRNISVIRGYTHCINIYLYSLQDFLLINLNQI